METFETLTERQVESREIYDGKILHVFEDTVTLPNGKPATREYLRHVGAVCMIPLLDDGSVLLERQFRYPVGRVMIEIPAGKLNYKEEDPREAAARELLEETGAIAGELIELGKFLPACAYCDEDIHMYLARKLTFREQKLDDDEFLNLFTMPLEDAVADVLAGKITDAKTQTALMKLWLMRERGML